MDRTVQRILDTTNKNRFNNLSIHVFLQAYTAAMQAQWGWLLQLTVCLENHMRLAGAYHGWWNQAREADSWLNSQTNRLNNYYTRPHVGLDEGEKLIREIQVSYIDLIFEVLKL